MRTNEKTENIINRIDRIEEDMKISNQIDSHYHDELMKVKEDVEKILKYLEAQNDGNRQW